MDYLPITLISSSNEYVIALMRERIAAAAHVTIFSVAFFGVIRPFFDWRREKMRLRRHRLKHSYVSRFAYQEKSFVKND